MRVALDAMGGDYAPVSTVEGAIEAVNEDKELSVILVGVFLFNTWAQEEMAFPTGTGNVLFSSGLGRNELLPESRMKKPEFIAKYKIGCTLLAHRAANEVIGEYISGYFGTSTICSIKSAVEHIVWILAVVVEGTIVKCDVPLV